VRQVVLSDAPVALDAVPTGFSIFKEKLKKKLDTGKIYHFKIILKNPRHHHYVTVNLRICYKTVRLKTPFLFHTFQHRNPNKRRKKNPLPLLNTCLGHTFDTWIQVMLLE